MVELFKNLRSAKILYLFLVSFLLGALCIWFNLYNRVIPVVIVLIYSIILFVPLKKHPIHLSDTEKNSPYFLGLIFTLFTLFDLSVKSGMEIELPFLFINLSIALSTTIVGLIMRQILLTISPPAEDYIKILGEIIEQLDDITAQYNKSRNIIVGFLEEYTKAKKSYSERDKKLSDKYIDTLRTQIFSKLEKEFPEKIESVLRSMSNYYVEDYETTIEQILPTGYQTEISDRMKNFHDEYMSSLKEDTQNFISSVNNLSTQLQTSFFTEASDEQMTQLKKEMTTIDESLRKFLDTFNKRLSNLSK